MAAWDVRCTGRVLDLLADDRREELLNELEIARQELDRWDEVGRPAAVIFRDDHID